MSESCNKSVSSKESKVSGTTYRTERRVVETHDHSLPYQSHHKDGVDFPQVVRNKPDKSRVDKFQVLIEPCRYESVECPVNLVTNTYRYDELRKEFWDVFSSQEVGCIGLPYDIKLKENVTPAVHAPRKTPFTLREKTINELHRMEKWGTIKKVDEATEWVNSMTVSEKTNEQIRVCLDPTETKSS